MDMDEEQAPLTKEDRELASSEARLQELEGRIQAVKGPQGGNKQFARGLALVASMGFVLAGCLIAGVWIGDFIVLKTGNKNLQVLGVLIGLFTAFYAGAKLLKPLMKSDD